MNNPDTGHILAEPSATGSDGYFTVTQEHCN
jgi:hypothetical protein